MLGWLEPYVYHDHRLELGPFSGIYTRIGLRDDITRGHSTFVVEMLELRAILRRAGRDALVIGDELCAGTEAPSALAIVGAGVVCRCAGKHTRPIQSSIN